MKPQEIQVFPSILSGDFGALAEEAKRIEESGADGIHLDIMDGHFVPNLTLGPKACSAIRKVTKLFLDVHLMIYNPFEYIEAFASAGADGITFHFEATEDVEETANFIRKCGKKVGISFRPETSFSMIPNMLPLADMVLLMTVSPGFGGQKFMPEVLEKIQLTRDFCEKNSLKGSRGFYDIQVDGGIIPETAKECVKAGANILVSGNYIFQQPTLKQGVDALKNCL